MLADKGYDANAFREQIKAQHGIPVIPGRKNRTRRIATRYDKTAASFLAFIYLASSVLLLK